MHDLDGNRIDRALLSPAQAFLLEKLRPMVRPAYEGRGWPLHYALGYLLADGGLYCVLTITHQVVYALHKYAPEHEGVKRELLYGRAFGATWMTEIQGGSDLGANRTLARKEGGAWRLYGGDKYFASGAGLAEKALKHLAEEGPWHAKEALRRLADAAAVYALERVGQDPFPELARLYARAFLEGEALPPSARRPELYDPWWSLS